MHQRINATQVESHRQHAEAAAPGPEASNAGREGSLLRTVQEPHHGRGARWRCVVGSSCDLYLPLITRTFFSSSQPYATHLHLSLAPTLHLFHCRLIPLYLPFLQDPVPYLALRNPRPARRERACPSRPCWRREAAWASALGPQTWWTFS